MQFSLKESCVLHFAVPFSGTAFFIERKVVKEWKRESP